MNLLLNTIFAVFIAIYLATFCTQIGYCGSDCSDLGEICGGTDKQKCCDNDEVTGVPLECKDADGALLDTSISGPMGSCEEKK